MNLPLNCSAIRAQLAEHLQAHLPPSEALVLDQHLRRCPACREVLALERRLRAGAVPRIAAPADFAAAVLAQPQRRPAPSGRVQALLETTAADTAFRAFVDPLLQLEMHLRDACAPLMGPLTTLQLQLQAEGLKLCQYLEFPLKQAGRQVCAALAGPTDAH